MKSSIIFLFIIFSTLSFSQNFRGLNWGASVSELKSINPSADWEIDKNDDAVFYITDDYVGGLKAAVIYAFRGDKLVAGMYNFNEAHISDNLYYDDFKTISSNLNEKYKMEKEENWNNDTWKKYPDYIGFALSLGHVSISEYYEDEKTFIAHDLSSDGSGGIDHILIYRDVKLVKSQRESAIDDF